jgi:biotin transport system substrate-specific component
MLLMYAVGVSYLYFIVNALAAPGAEITFRTAVAWGFTPFILFDSIKAVIAAVSSRALLPILRRQGLVQ